MEQDMPAREWFGRATYAGYDGCWLAWSTDQLWDMEAEQLKADFRQPGLLISQVCAFERDGGPPVLVIIFLNGDPQMLDGDPLMRLGGGPLRLPLPQGIRQYGDAAYEGCYIFRDAETNEGLILGPLQPTGLRFRPLPNGN